MKLKNYKTLAVIKEDCIKWRIPQLIDKVKMEDYHMGEYLNKYRKLRRKYYGKDDSKLILYLGVRPYLVKEIIPSIRIYMTTKDQLKVVFDGNLNNISAVMAVERYFGMKKVKAWRLYTRQSRGVEVVNETAERVKKTGGEFMRDLLWVFGVNGIRRLWISFRDKNINIGGGVVKIAKLEKVKGFLKKEEEKYGKKLYVVQERILVEKREDKDAKIASWWDIEMVNRISDLEGKSLCSECPYYPECIRDIRSCKTVQIYHPNTLFLKDYIKEFYLKEVENDINENREGNIKKR